MGRIAMRGRPIFSNLIHVSIIIRRNIKVDSRNFGDIDNHAKAVLDAMNGVVFSDDKLVVSLNVRKEKNAREGVDISVEPLNVS